MVRVISEKLFSPPRSRHSSGETVDKELAARAVEVLSGLNSRRLELSDYESSSDSHWDSEVDVEGDGAESLASRAQTSADGKSGGTDVLRKRKERRRERNKLSAQAYRVRRKEQSAKQQTVLKTLQEENTRLKSVVQGLEEELQTVRHSLRQRFPTTFSKASATPTPCPDASTDASPPSPGSSSPSSNTPASFCQMTEASRGPYHHKPMDNDQSCRQQISPVVDNFIYSKPPASSSPVPGAMNIPGMAPAFSFSTSSVIGARHNFSATPFLTTTLPTISEKPDVHLGHHHPHPHPLQSQLQQHDDLNSNANTFAFTNANTINANANMFGMYQNSNCMNNNNLFQAVPVRGEGGACADLHPQQAAFKVCRV